VAGGRGGRARPLGSSSPRRRATTGRSRRARNDEERDQVGGERRDGAESEQDQETQYRDREADHRATSAVTVGEQAGHLNADADLRREEEDTERGHGWHALRFRRNRYECGGDRDWRPQSRSNRRARLVPAFKSRQRQRQRAMATADEQIRVSDRVKRYLDRCRRSGESYNDVLERLLSERCDGDFGDGFGLLSDEQADRLREARDCARTERKGRTCRLGEDR